MKLVVAAVRPTPILWWRASGLESPVEVPASTLPARGMAPVRANIASRSVVLPLWKGPTSAMHRGPWALLMSCPIAASLVGARPLIGSAGQMLPLPSRFGKPEKRREGFCIVFRKRLQRSRGDDATQSRDLWRSALSLGHPDQQAGASVRATRGPECAAQHPGNAAL